MSCDVGGKKGRGGGGGGNRGVRGVDFGLGIGFSSEPSGTPSSKGAPSRSGVINSVRTGVMAQFKNSFVAATPSNPQNQAYPNKRPSLMGFVSGGTIGGDMGRIQSQPPPAAPTHNASLHNSSQKHSQRFDSF